MTTLTEYCNYIVVVLNIDDIVAIINVKAYAIFLKWCLSIIITINLDEIWNVFTRPDVVIKGTSSYCFLTIYVVSTVYFVISSEL